MQRLSRHISMSQLQHLCRLGRTVAGFHPKLVPQLEHACSFRGARPVLGLRYAMTHELPRWLRGKESACQYGRCKKGRFNPWVEKIPWRRKWQPTPVFLPGQSHGQRCLVGCTTWSHKELETTEHAHTCNSAYVERSGLGLIRLVGAVTLQPGHQSWPSLLESCLGEVRLSVSPS